MSTKQKTVSRRDVLSKYSCKQLFTLSEQNTEFHILPQQAPLQHLSQNITEFTADFQPKANTKLKARHSSFFV